MPIEIIYVVSPKHFIIINTHGVHVSCTLHNKHKHCRHKP